jgi:hypothetical protein
MIKLTKEEFLKWAEDNHWLKTIENPTPNGRQDTYMTPAGSLAIAIYDIKGELQNVGALVFTPPAQGPQPTKFPFDISGGMGGKRFPPP